MSNDSIPNSETETTYTLEVFSKVSGLDVERIRYYKEIGVIRPPSGEADFDTESLRQIRRVEHLRESHDLNETALKLVNDLLCEVEDLRERLRGQR